MQALVMYEINIQIYILYILENCNRKNAHTYSTLLNMFLRENIIYIHVFDSDVYVEIGKDQKQIKSQNFE